MSVFHILRLARDYLWPHGSAMFSASDVVGDESKPAINFLRGWPNPSLLPVEQIKAAANAVLSDLSIARPGLLYGPDEGNEAFRKAVADWLSSFYRPSKPVSFDRICINGGASQSLGAILGVYTDPSYTRNVWFVAPAYMLAFRIFEDAGFGDKMRAVPEDEEGIDIEYLRKAIQKSEDDAKNTAPHYKPDRERAKVYKHVIYCVPTFANPSSRTMTLKRRKELVRLGREFDVLIVCDDVYDFLQWPADIDSDRVMLSANPTAMKTSHLPRLVDVDREIDGGTTRSEADGFGNVCSNGTFSKLAGPGLRCGWIEASSKFAYGVSQAGIQRSGGAPCQLTSTYVTRLVASGQLQEHIQTVLRPAYASRYGTMSKAIEQHLLPLGFRMPQPDRNVIGGYFLWLSLPEGLRAADLTRLCKEEENLVIAPGSLFEVPGDDSIKFDTSIRLCFAAEDELLLSEGVRRIGEVAKRMLSKDQAAADGDFVMVGKNSNKDDLQRYM